MKNNKEKEHNGEVLYIQFIFGSKPVFSLGLWPDFHLVILFALCISFSCYSRKTLK